MGTLEKEGDRIVGAVNESQAEGVEGTITKDMHDAVSGEAEREGVNPGEQHPAASVGPGYFRLVLNMHRDYSAVRDVAFHHVDLLTLGWVPTRWEHPDNGVRELREDGQWHDAVTGEP